MADYIEGVSSRPASYGGLSDMGLWTSLAGAALNAVGNYYAVKGQQHQLESQALNAEHLASMSAINARAAEQDAHAVMEAGRREAGRVSAQYGQVKAEHRAVTAGRGIKATGSAAEVQASIEAAKQEDVFTVNSNAIRAAGRLQAEAVNERNQANLSRVSAANLRGTAGSMDPYLAAGTSLLTSASEISERWLYRNRSSRSRY